MYKDRYGITVVRDDDIIDRLSISRDNHGEGHIAVLLHIPEVSEHDHSHIELNREQATVLRDWLDDYLKDDLDAREIKDEKETQKKWDQMMNKSNNPQSKDYEGER